jgi:hypothetical protein
MRQVSKIAQSASLSGFITGRLDLHHIICRSGV